MINSMILIEILTGLAIDYKENEMTPDTDKIMNKYFFNNEEMYKKSVEDINKDDEFKQYYLNKNNFIDIIFNNYGDNKDFEGDKYKNYRVVKFFVTKPRDNMAVLLKENRTDDNDKDNYAV